MNLRCCLREPVPEIEIAAQRLDDAVSAHVRGERYKARFGGAKPLPPNPPASV